MRNTPFHHASSPIPLQVALLLTLYVQEEGEEEKLKMTAGVVLYSETIDKSGGRWWMLTTSERCVEILALSKHWVRLGIGQ